MADLSFIDAEITGATGVGVDPVDPRFTRACDSVEKGKYAEAAEAAQEVFDEGVYDVRLFCYYVYQAFRELGLAGLAPAFNSLRTLHTDRWDAFGPADRKAIHFDRAATWLFQTLSDALEYHEAKVDDIWRDWTNGADVEDVTAGIAAAELLLGLLTDKTYERTTEQLGRSLRILREIQRKMDKPVDATPVLDLSDDLDATDPNAQTFVGKLPQLEVGGRVLRGSHRFAELLDKLEAFEDTVNNRDYRKAAVVSDDILKLIEDFDPREYFPDLFASFFSYLSENVNEITPFWERRDTIDWQTLTQFYKVDLQSFIGRRKDG